MKVRVEVEVRGKDDDDAYTSARELMGAMIKLIDNTPKTQIEKVEIV